VEVIVVAMPAADFIVVAAIMVEVTVADTIAADVIMAVIAVAFTGRALGLVLAGDTLISGSI
jgi:hypothetical protein